MRCIICLFLFPFAIFAQSPTDSSSLYKKDRSEITVDPREKAKQQIEALRQRVLNWESFAVLATLYSEDPGSAKNGGLYKNIGRGMFVPEFERVAFSTKPGETSEVFETQYGFHFLQIVSNRIDTVDVRHILVKVK